MALPKMLRGNTYRHTFTFLDWESDDGIPVLVDPSIVKFIVYDENFTRLSENTLSASNRLSTGKYRFFHTPQDEGTFWFEWYGDIDGLPTLDRDKAIVSNSR